VSRCFLVLSFLLAACATTPVPVQQKEEPSLLGVNLGMDPADIRRTLKKQGYIVTDRRVDQSLTQMIFASERHDAVFSGITLETCTADQTPTNLIFAGDYAARAMKSANHLGVTQYTTIKSLAVLLQHPPAGKASGAVVDTTANHADVYAWQVGKTGPYAIQMVNNVRILSCQGVLAAQQKAEKTLFREIGSALDSVVRGGRDND
jgi:hypothetical protein